MLSSRLSRNKARLLLLSRHTSTTNDAKSMQTPNPCKISTDMVGPPDPVSNLRKFIYKRPSNETNLEKRYRELRVETQRWNHKFWTQHNSRFFQERENYLKKNLPEGKQNLTADEMSVFYKAFLDKNWKAHMTYNIEWYKKNITLLGLAIQVKLGKIFRLKRVKKYIFVSFCIQKQLPIITKKGAEIGYMLVTCVLLLAFIFVVL